MKDPNNKSVPPGRTAWVKGNLSTEEDALARKAVRGRRFLDSAEEAEELLGELDGEIEEAYGGSGGKILPLPQKKRSYGRYLAAAAAILLLLAAGIWWSSQSEIVDNEQLFADHFEHFSNDLIVRTMGEEIGESEKMKRQALQAYEEKNYSQAIANINQYLASSARPDSSLLLYRGISELAEGSITAAKQSLQMATNFGYKADAVAWYLALAKLKNGQTETAKIDLEAIANSGSLFRNRAKSLLEQL